MLKWLYTYVLSVCHKCFIYSRGLLQVFYLDVTKVDLDVAYTCMLQAYVSNVFRCFVCMFASVSSECCICNVFQVFSQVFQTLASSVSSVLLYVATVAFLMF
jgi:hypothetical protein